MDENLARLNRLYPNSRFVQIAKYDPNLWKDREYDSSFDNKATITKWKSKPLNYEDAQALADEGWRIGWIVPHGYVVVDIDNKDSEYSQDKLERLLKKFEVAYSYNYTNKGIHILFRDDSDGIKSEARSKCALNIEVDTRANGTGYIILPTNDPHREWGKWNDMVEDIPYFLKPLTKNNIPSFVGMTEGDGRNSALFKWRTILEATNKLTNEQVEKSVRIINENIFETPMPNNELFKTVLRSREKEAKPDATEKENIYNKIADDLIAKFDIISFYDNFWKFNGTYYKRVTETELERLIHFESSRNLSSAGRKEIIAFIKVKTQVNMVDFDKDWYKVAVANGVLNLVTGEVEVPNKNDVNTIFIPHQYNNDPEYSPRIDQFMKDITNGDPIKMEFLYQVAGYCLLKRNQFEKFFIFQGEGGTGKSTFMNLIQKMVSEENCSHVALADFDKDYYLASTLSKLVNLDDDIVDSRALEASGRFKSFVSGNVITVRQIYREPIEFAPYATLIFNCNKLPKIMDKTSGLYRRMILVELNHKVAKPDPSFMLKVTDQDMEYFLYKAVQGIKVALEEGKFRVTQSSEDLLLRFKRRQSPFTEWVYDAKLCLGDIVNHRCMALYKEFTNWCGDNGYVKVLTMYSFKEEVATLFDVSIDFVDDNDGRVKIQQFVKRGEYDPNYKPF